MSHQDISHPSHLWATCYFKSDKGSCNFIASYVHRFVLHSQTTFAGVGGKKGVMQAKACWLVQIDRAHRMASNSHSLNYTTARSTNLSKDWENYYNIKKELYKKCRNSHKNFLSSLLCSENKPTIRFWALIKNKYKAQDNINTVMYS